MPCWIDEVSYDDECRGFLQSDKGRCKYCRVFEKWLSDVEEGVDELGLLKFEPSNIITPEIAKSIYENLDLIIAALGRRQQLQLELSSFDVIDNRVRDLQAATYALERLTQRQAQLQQTIAP